MGVSDITRDELLAEVLDVITKEPVVPDGWVTVNMQYNYMIAQGKKITKDSVHRMLTKAVAEGKMEKRPLGYGVINIYRPIVKEASE